ncbi:unnamed protein product [Gongylonema pulchrum]|uniref:Uncharacterized protein n=1 Tax=Gongylonema pulchrum TaxID=637853 RepID=A0A183D8F6_9BILA|nr:unnamed protein product [Gongylonema pulchrum]
MTIESEDISSVQSASINSLSRESMGSTKPDVRVIDPVQMLGKEKGGKSASQRSAAADSHEEAPPPVKDRMKHAVKEEARKNANTEQKAVGLEDEKLQAKTRRGGQTKRKISTRENAEPKPTAAAREEASEMKRSTVAREVNGTGRRAGLRGNAKTSQASRGDAEANLPGNAREGAEIRPELRDDPEAELHANVKQQAETQENKPLKQKDEVFFFLEIIYFQWSQP